MDSLFLETVLNEVIFYALLFSVMLISQKIIDLLFNSLFSKFYKSASVKGRAIHRKRYETLASAFRGIASVLLWVIAIIVILAHYNVNYAALLTGAGAFGLFISIASRDVILDIYVGMMALLEDQYRVGDYVKINDSHSGVVEEITLRTVRLRDEEGAVHIVPHSMARAVVNKTFDYAKVNLEISISIATELDEVKRVINEVGESLASDEKWKSKILEPIAYESFLKYDESQMTVKASGKVKPGKQWALESEFRLRLKSAFESNSIELNLKSSK